MWKHTGYKNNFVVVWASKFLCNWSDERRHKIYEETHFENALSTPAIGYTFNLNIYDVMPCSPVKSAKVSRTMYHLLLWTKSKLSEHWFTLWPRRSDMFLWNDGWLSPNYTAFYTRRQNSSNTQMLGQFREPKNIQHNINDSTSLWHFWTCIKYCDHKCQDKVPAIIQINQLKMTTYKSQK